MENRMLFDWFTMSSAIDDFDSIIEKIGLEDFADDFMSTGRAMNCYKNVKTLNGISILSNNINENVFGVCVTMSGQGMRFFENNSKKSLYDVFNMILNKGQEDLDNVRFTMCFMANEDLHRQELFRERYIIGKKPVYNISRLDFAFDDFSGVIPFEMMIEKSKNNEVISLSKKSAHTVTSSWQNGVNGRTFSVGKRGSNMYTRVYDKKAEQLAKDNLDIDVDTWIRFELEIRYESAVSFANKLVNERIPAAELFTGVVSSHMRFVDKSDDSNKWRWKTNEEWETFLEDAEKIRLASDLPEEPYTKEKLDKNLKKLRNMIYTITLTTPAIDLNRLFADIIYDDETDFKKLHPKYKKLIAEYTVDDNLLNIYEEYKNSQYIITQLQKDVAFYRNIACQYAPDPCEVPF